jgi:DNA-binding NarL/FixJ family response regulator
MRLLVVDREQAVREVIQDLLADYEIEVRQAASRGEAGLELRRIAFDVLLCHLSMLREGGGWLIREGRRTRPGLRIVAMSASGSRATPAEADAMLQKPFTRAELLDALRKDSPPAPRPAAASRAPTGLS